MATPFDHLTDKDLDEMRLEQKVKLSAGRPKTKLMQFTEQQFMLQSMSGEGRLYRLYKRFHPELVAVFSVGLAVRIGEDWLTLCRYNGSYHPHRNELEGNRLTGVPHIHTATQRYILRGKHPDGFAEATDRYESIDGAFRCVLIDCKISGIVPDGDADPDTYDLFEP